MTPSISKHYQQREPSAIRKAQILFNSRKDKKHVKVINLAIGNISLPMHPVMVERMKSIGERHSPFVEGIVKYTSTEGTQECQKAFISAIKAELKNEISLRQTLAKIDGMSSDKILRPILAFPKVLKAFVIEALNFCALAQMKLFNLEFDRICAN